MDIFGTRRMVKSAGRYVKNSFRETQIAVDIVKDMAHSAKNPPKPGFIETDNKKILARIYGWIALMLFNILFLFAGAANCFRIGLDFSAYTCLFMTIIPFFYLIRSCKDLLEFKDEEE